jgi:hypothetical protein
MSGTTFLVAGAINLLKLREWMKLHAKEFLRSDEKSSGLRKVSESLTSIMMGDAFKNLDVED